MCLMMDWGHATLERAFDIVYDLHITNLSYCIHRCCSNLILSENLPRDLFRFCNL